MVKELIDRDMIPLLEVFKHRPCHYKCRNPLHFSRQEEHIQEVFNRELLLTPTQDSKEEQSRLSQGFHSCRDRAFDFYERKKVLLRLHNAGNRLYEEVAANPYLFGKRRI